MTEQAGSGAADLPLGSIEALLFDIGGVFLIPHPEPIRDWHKERGVALDAPDEAFRRAHFRGVRAIADADVGAAEGDPLVWSAYDVGFYGELGVPVPPESLRRWDWPLADNIAAFHTLARGHRAVAVLSNNNGTADQQMIDHGVGQVGAGPLPELVCVIDSGVVGLAKPDPAIFEPALEALALAPEQVLYVGDTVHADVRGATAAGLPVVQLDPYDFHADLGHPRVADLPALVELLDRTER